MNLLQTSTYTFIWQIGLSIKVSTIIAIQVDFILHLNVGVFNVIAFTKYTIASAIRIMVETFVSFKCVLMNI